MINKNIELLNREIVTNKSNNNLFLLYTNQMSLAGSYKSRATVKKGSQGLKIMNYLLKNISP